MSADGQGSCSPAVIPPPPALPDEDEEPEPWLPEEPDDPCEPWLPEEPDDPCEPWLPEEPDDPCEPWLPEELEDCEPWLPEDPCEPDCCCGMAQAASRAAREAASAQLENLMMRSLADRSRNAR
jgi:hypothetical protein